MTVRGDCFSQTPLEYDDNLAVTTFLTISVLAGILYSF